MASPDEHHLAKKGIHISVRANDARLVHWIIGSATNSVNGVAAEPVDSFDWSGSEITPIRGHAKLEIDPVTNTYAGGPEMTANVPPLLSFFYYVSFSKVKNQNKT